MYLAVGSYGTDPSLGGLCYRVSTDTLDRDVIFQVVSLEDMSTFATGPEVNTLGTLDGIAFDIVKLLKIPRYFVIPALTFDILK